jgi:hypothetical protein
MNAMGKTDLWLKMGEAVGVPEKQLQAVRNLNQRLPDGAYRVSWTDKFAADSALEAAEFALVKLFVEGNMLRPSSFVLTVEGNDGKVSFDYLGARFLKGLQAGIDWVYPVQHAGAASDTKAGRKQPFTERDREVGHSRRRVI